MDASSVERPRTAPLRCGVAPEDSRMHAPEPVRSPGSACHHHHHHHHRDVDVCACGTIEVLRRSSLGPATPAASVVPGSRDARRSRPVITATYRVGAPTEGTPRASIHRPTKEASNSRRIR